MQLTDKIYIAGHTGLSGSAFRRHLESRGYKNLLLRTHQQLDLTHAKQVDDFFAAEKPDHVILAAAKVGGIKANNDYPADFININLAIQQNVLNAAYKYQIKRLCFLASSCIYPRAADQPITEDALLNGPLEPTNRPYAVAKIAGIEQCWAYNRQYQTQFLALMPCNLYGIGDNYDLNSSHVLAALIRKIHDAKTQGLSNITVWGTGKPRREFLFADDLAAAGVFLLNLADAEYNELVTNNNEPPLVNVGSGTDLTILELVELIKNTLNYSGEIIWDSSMPDGTPRKLLDISKIITLGWKPSIKLEVGIKQAYQDFLSLHLR